jgi:hypothetical protein
MVSTLAVAASERPRATGLRRRYRGAGVAAIPQDIAADLKLQGQSLSGKRAGDILSYAVGRKRARISRRDVCLRERRDRQDSQTRSQQQRSPHEIPPVKEQPHSAILPDQARAAKLVPSNPIGTRFVWCPAATNARTPSPRRPPLHITVTVTGALYRSPIASVGAGQIAIYGASNF